MNKNTLVVNLFGSPGSGKSSGAAYIFFQLKRAGIDCELVTEYAKDKCWEHSCIFDDSTNQFYIGAKQYYRVNRVNNKVDIVVTDSPVLLSCFYNSVKELGNEYNIVVKRLFNRFRNLNFFINRLKPYNPNVRNQTEEESNKIASKMKKIIKEWGIEFTEVNGNDDGYNKILEIIKERFKNEKKTPPD